MLKLLKLLLLVVWVSEIRGNYIAIDLSVNQTEINTLGSYTFTLRRDFDPLAGNFITPSSVSIGSIIQLIFPSDFLTLSSNSNIISCTDISTGLSLNCSLSLSSNMIIVNNYYLSLNTTGNYYPSIRVDGIMNPPQSGQTGNFLYYIKDTSGVVIDQSPSTNNGIYNPTLTFTPGMFLLYSISASGATILTRDKIIVTLTPRNQISSTDEIVLDFPLTWTNDLEGNRILITTPTCTPISNTASTISCTYTTIGSPVNRTYITVKGITSTTLSSSFSFSIQSILTPTTIDSSDHVYISSRQVDGSEIDTCTTVVSNLSPIQLQSVGFEVVGSGVVQAGCGGRVVASVAKPFAYYDTVVFKVPGCFLYAVVSSVSFSSFSQARDASSSTITLSNFPSTSSMSTSSQLNFTLQNITNPISIAPVTITISFYRLGSLYQQSTISYSAVAGIAKSFNVMTGSNLVYTNGPAQMQINSTLIIPSGSRIKLTYPSTVIVPNTNISTPITSSFLNGISITLSTFRVISNTIYFENIFQSNFINGTILINFSQFYNPLTVQPTTYLMTVETVDGWTIFTATMTLTATLKSLVGNSITSTSYKVLDTSVLTITVQLNYAATAISIILSSDINIMTGFESTCLPNTLNSCYLNGYNLTFEGNFQPGVQNLSFGNVKNPNSLQPTQSFSIYTYYRGWGVEKSLGNIYLQMNQTSSFASILVIPSSLVNSDQITVTITINFPTNSSFPGILTITFPLDLDISSSICNITCTKIGNNLTYTIGNWLSTLGIMINNVINAPSFKPIDNFVVSLVNSNNYGSLYQIVGSWTNNIASNFNTIVNSGDAAYRGENALFNFNITSINGKQSFVVVQFSALFGVLTIAPSGATLIGSRNVRYNIQNMTSFQFSMTLLTPVVFGNYTFSTQTYLEIGNNQLYLIGQSTSNIWHHTCYNTLCRSCNPTNTSICLDCYNTSISDYYIFDTSLQTCTRDCLYGYFMLGNICSPCATNCIQCANVSTNCTACNATLGLFLDRVYMKCVLTCTSGYYPNTQTQSCLPCSLPCLYCSTSPTTCTYCPMNLFLLNQQCVTNCPLTGQFIQNSITRNCDLCNSNCLTCQNTTTTCLSCNTTALMFLENNRCVLQCMTNSFRNMGTGTCVPCQSPCNLCYNDSTVCSTCLSTSSTPIYFNYGCINSTSCPLGNFVNIQNSSCNSCPTQCTSCTSLMNCTACNTNYTLYQGSCIASCPNTTYQLNRVCLPCTGCLTCNLSPQQCTSCVPSQFLYNGICYTSCPDGTYPNSTTKACQLCKSDCPTCRNTTYCLTCVSSLYFYLGSCFPTCPNSTFATTSSNSQQICQLCPIQCSQCTSSTQCQQCRTGYNLQNDSSCVMTCSKGIAYNQICYPCGLNCAICDTNLSQCQLCNTNYYIYQGKCLANCPSTTLSLNGLSCVSCTVKFGDQCTTCSFNQCLSCSSGELSRGQCIPCSQGTYSQNGSCTNCPSSCKSCYNQTYCISCISNYYIQSNYCTNICPLNKIPNGTICTVCIDYCSICNIQNSLCSVCISGYYLYENRCVSQCPLYPLYLVVNLNSTKCVTQEQYYTDYSKEAKIVYFPFSIAAGILFIIAIVIKCYSKVTHLITLSCSVISVAESGGWVAFLYVEFEAFKNYHYDSQKGLILTIVAIAILIMLAIIQIAFYCKYLRVDMLFSKWQKSHICTDRVFLILSVIFNFKLYRIIHSRLLQRDQFSMKLISPNKLLPFSLLSIISIAICSLPVMIGASLALYFSISRDQEFFAALDCLTITSIMVVLTLLDLRHEATYFIQQFESTNLKKQIYEEDSMKISMNGDGDGENVIQDKNMSKGELLLDVGANFPTDTGTKFKGQSDLRTTFNQSQTKSLRQQQQQRKLKATDENVQQIVNIQQSDNNNEFEQIQSSTGDQGINNRRDINNCQESQQNLISEQEIISQQEQKVQHPKWVQKKFDRHGYLLKSNQQGELQRYDQNRYRVVIDDHGLHRRFDKDGNEVELFMGEYCVKDYDGFYVKDGKRVDKRGYEVRKNDQDEYEFFDNDGFKVVEDENGDIRLYDEHGFQIVKDQNGGVHKINQDGYQAHISQSGKITYKDKDGNFVRKNQNGQYETYDPEDGFRTVVNEDGKIQKFDTNGYRIQRDKWGNIYRYDSSGYRVIINPNNTISKFDKDGYQIVIGQNGQIKRYDKEGYEMRKDNNGKRRFYDQNGYEVVRDYDGDVTLYDEDGYIVVIDTETGEHRRYTQEGLRVVRQEDGSIRFYDKRNHQVVQLPQGLYKKLDSSGNVIQLDEFGFQTQLNPNGSTIRYNKIGDIVNQHWFEKQLKEEQRMKQQQGIQHVSKLRRFKVVKEIDLQKQYNKMIGQQNLYMDDENVLMEEDNGDDLIEFHNPQIYQPLDLEQQLTDLREQQLGKQLIIDNNIIDINLLTTLHQIDHSPQIQINQKLTQQIHIKKNGNFIQCQTIQNDPKQNYIELKSIADVSINERSFDNQGVQPIDDNDGGDSHEIYSELESLDGVGTGLGVNSKKRGRGQRSEMSIGVRDSHDTKTEYNHKMVNVNIKKNNVYDQSEEIESLNEENWVKQAQEGVGVFNVFTKDISNANTNTNMNDIIFMQDTDDHVDDTLSSFVKQSTHFSHNPSIRQQPNLRYNFDKNTIQQMQDQLFQKGLDQKIKQRKQFKLSNGPNPLVEYMKNLQTTKKSLQQKMYFEDLGKKKRRRDNR